jgi:acetoin utilization deacetylase AcuC-like enzyme
MRDRIVPTIVDIDVHHGNGTQEIVWNNPGVFFTSCHQQSLFPAGSGTSNECGAFNNVLNVPLPAHTDGLSYRHALSEFVLPRLVEFKPDLLLTSAGFDGHRDDPLGDFDLDEKDYAWISMALLDAAHELCQDRFIAVLEGGYNLNALATSVGAFIKPMMEVK